MPEFSLAAYRAARAPVRATLRFYLRVRTLHSERVPAFGGLIMAANHASYIDSLLLGAFSPRPVRFMMLKSFYDKPFIHFWASLLGAFPVDDHGVTKFTLRNSQGVLRAGQVLGIFPEGGRSRDGSLMPGRPGAVLLAMQEKVPITPVALLGTFKSYPSGRLIPRPGRVTVLFGEPFIEHIACEYPRDRKRLPELTELLMGRIRRLMEEGP